MTEAELKIEHNIGSKTVYGELLAKLNGLGKYEIDPKKTSIHINHGRAFLGVNPLKDGLMINIVTQNPIVNYRIKKMEQVSAHRFHNEVFVGSPEELDSELIGWISEAYQLTS